jgi:hypothetical protein
MYPSSSRTESVCAGKRDRGPFPRRVWPRYWALTVFPTGIGLALCQRAFWVAPLAGLPIASTIACAGVLHLSSPGPRGSIEPSGQCTRCRNRKRSPCKRITAPQDALQSESDSATRLRTRLNGPSSAIDRVQTRQNTSGSLPIASPRVLTRVADCPRLSIRFERAWHARCRVRSRREPSGTLPDASKRVGRRRAVCPTRSGAFCTPRRTRTA